MSTTLAPAAPPRRWIVALSAVLGTAALAYFGYQLLKLVAPDDNGRMETTLAGSVASQLRLGFGALYGPFDGTNPLVLIHAPLYYRLAAVLAWPLTRIGLDSGWTGLAMGRMLSVAATFGLIFLADRLARLDGAPRRAGLWAACLVATSPVLGILSVMVRPDTTAAFLQTLGVWLVLRAVRDGSNRLSLAYVLFALAFCAKQHSVFAAGVCSLGLVVAFWRGRVHFGPVVLAHATGAGVALLYLASEEWLTGRRMSHAVFVLPGGPFRAINYATWGHVGTIGLITAKKSIGLIALAVALIATGGRVRRPGPLDAALLAFLGFELALFVPLCLFNLGASDNYALQAVLFAAVLLGRALGRATEAVPARAWRLAPIMLAALIVLGRDAQLIRTDLRTRSDDETNLSALFDDPAVAGRGREEFYFVGLPQHNRTRGRAGLAHDEWLYAAFESVGDAEPREVWLRQPLADGSVRQVVIPDDTDIVPGVGPTLPDLGFERIGRFGPYRLWQLRRGPSLAAGGVRR